MRPTQVFVDLYCCDERF